MILIDIFLEQLQAFYQHKVRMMIVLQNSLMIILMEQLKP